MTTIKDKISKQELIKGEYYTIDDEFIKKYKEKYDYFGGIDNYLFEYKLLYRFDKITTCTRKPGCIAVITLYLKKYSDKKHKLKLYLTEDDLTDDDLTKKIFTHQIEKQPEILQAESYIITDLNDNRLFENKFNQECEKITKTEIYDEDTGKYIFSNIINIFSSDIGNDDYIFMDIKKNIYKIKNIEINNNKIFLNYINDKNEENTHGINLKKFQDKVEMCIRYIPGAIRPENLIIRIDEHEKQKKIFENFKQEQINNKHLKLLPHLHLSDDHIDKTLYYTKIGEYNLFSGICSKNTIDKPLEFEHYSQFIRHTNYINHNPPSLYKINDTDLKEIHKIYIEEKSKGGKRKYTRRNRRKSVRRNRRR